MDHSAFSKTKNVEIMILILFRYVNWNSNDDSVIILEVDERNMHESEKIEMHHSMQNKKDTDKLTQDFLFLHSFTS